MKQKYLKTFAPKGALKIGYAKKAALDKASLVISRAVNKYLRKKKAPARRIARRTNIINRASAAARAAAAARFAARPIERPLTAKQITNAIAYPKYNRELKAYNKHWKKKQARIAARSQMNLAPLLLANAAGARGLTPAARQLRDLQRRPTYYGYRGASWDYHDTDWAPARSFYLPLNP